MVKHDRRHDRVLSKPHLSHICYDGLWQKQRGPLFYIDKKDFENIGEPAI